MFYFQLTTKSVNMWMIIPRLIWFHIQKIAPNFILVRTWVIFFIFKNKNISPKNVVFANLYIFLGWRGGYIAHLMDCPPTTGFDTKLRICNYIRALPRCNKGMTHFFPKKTLMPRTSALFPSHRCIIV